MPDAADTPTFSRVYVFVDFWNLTLNLNTLHKKETGSDFHIDWDSPFRNLIMSETEKLIGRPCQYIGMFVCGSYVSTESDKKLLKWAQYTLGKFAGVTQEFKQRQRRRDYIICPDCHEQIKECPKCKADIRGTSERAWIQR